MARRNPESMPAGEKFTLKEKFESLKGIIAFSILVILMLGGIFAGVFSPSEGGSIGAAGAFIIMIVRRRATFKIIWECLKGTAKITGMIFILMIGAEYFGTMLALTRMPTMLATSLSSWESGFLVIWVVILVYIILGMAIDTLPLITILTPIFFPLVMAMGWDPLWFGNIMVMCMLLGLISPPDGIPVYIMSQISGQPLMKCFWACAPFFLMLFIMLILMVYIPALSTWLPAFIGA
jgi:tripartite ATP-independent transporter DctM subunit